MRIVHKSSIPVDRALGKLAFSLLCVLCGFERLNLPMCLPPGCARNARNVRDARDARRARDACRARRACG